MARCPHCGRVNRDGSVFCQDCGHRLGPDEQIPATRVKMPTPAAGVPVGVSCPTCGAPNPPGMNFCKMCGGAIRPPSPQGSGLPSPAAVSGGGLPSAAAVARPHTPAPVAPAPAPQAAAPGGHRTCAVCGGHTPSAFSFCQHCGARLAAAPVAGPPAPVPQRSQAYGGQDAVAATLAVSPGTPPAGVPHAGGDAFAPTMAPSGAQLAAAGLVPGAPGRVPTPPMPAPGGRPQTPLPVPGQFGAAPPPARPATPVPAPSPFAAPPSPFVPAPAPARASAFAPAAYGRLVAVHRDGTDGAVFMLAAEQVAIGRVEGDLTFAEDRYLAARHAVIERRGAAVVVRSLDPVNGVYLRLHEPWQLADGDQFLLGKEVFRFEALDPMERDPPAAIQHGVLFFGSPPRSPWGRLRQIITSGGTRDVVHLFRPEVVLGREDGELRFPDDEFMSRRHAGLSHHGGRVQLMDLGSSNGTYVRLRGERELRPRDLLRLGDQLLRYEPA